jgi:hypothetical protein
MRYVTEVPSGYEDAPYKLSNSNDVVLVHEDKPPMIYDESVMDWVELNVSGACCG